MGKKKVLWVSDLVIETGFSRVAHSLIERLKNDFEIVGLGINYVGDPHPYDFKIYPAFVGGYGDIYGFNRITSLIKSVNPDLIFILNDAFIQSKYLEILKEKDIKIPVVTYTPVDGENHDPYWYKDFGSLVKTAVAYTNFGKNVIQGCFNVLNIETPIEVIPHGVDKKDFYLIDKDIKRLRQEFFNTDKFDNDFIFLNANRNQPRKRLDITMMAFAEFSRNKPDVKLYMHCGVKDVHINVLKLAKYLGIDSKLIYSGNVVGIQQISRQDLNKIYNVCDVGLNTSWGEGWGLVNMEHAATGKPQIVSTYSSFPEVLGDSAIYVEPIMDIYVENTDIKGKLLHPSHVAQAMEMLYNDRNLYSELSRNALIQTGKPEFDWDNIAAKFKNVFERAIE